MSVFITDGNSRIALAAARALGKMGIDVIIGESEANSIAAMSKYTHQEIVYPSPILHATEFKKCIIDLVRNSKAQILLPMSDITIQSIYPIKEVLEEYVKIPVPEQESYEYATDKKKLLQLAHKLQIPVPRTYFVNSEEELVLLSRDLNYPVVVKPRYSKVFWKGMWYSLLVSYAYSTDELLHLYKNLHQKSPFTIIQEKIDGFGCGLSVLIKRGEVIAAFAHRRIREIPPSGGVSVLRKSIPLDQGMFQISKKLLNALNWSGVAMVEFKIDQKDRIPKLMEVNSRFWGSLQLAIDAGVNFPYLLYLSAIGQHQTPCLSYKTEIKSRWLLGDLDNLLALWLIKRKNLNLTNSYPGRLKALVHFLNFFNKNSKFEVFSLQDPMPGLGEIKHYMRRLGDKVDYVKQSHTTLH